MGNTDIMALTAQELNDMSSGTLGGAYIVLFNQWHSQQTPGRQRRSSAGQQTPYGQLRTVCDILARRHQDDQHYKEDNVATHETIVRLGGAFAREGNGELAREFRKMGDYFRAKVLD